MRDEDREVAIVTVLGYLVKKYGRDNQLIIPKDELIAMNEAKGIRWNESIAIANEEDRIVIILTTNTMFGNN